MSNKDFAVQEELLKFAVLAAVHAFGSSDVRDAPTISKDAVREVVSSVLIFLSENPMVPTDEQIKKLAPWLPDFHSSKIERVRRTIVEWQRECFLASDQEESAYMRVVKALGAVTLSREEGNRIVEYVGGAIHDGIRSPEPEIPISFSCPQCGVDITDRSIPFAHKSAAGRIMPGHLESDICPSRDLSFKLKIEELAALSLGMEGLCVLHSEHKDAGPIRECACEYAKAFRVISDMRRKDSK